MNRIKTIPAILLLLAVLVGCGSLAKTQVPTLLEPVGVQPDMAKAYIGEIYDITCYDSKVVPYVENLAFDMSGTVAQIYFYPGMWVEAGDVLAVLDYASVEQQMQQLQDQMDYIKRNSTYEDALAELEIQSLQVQLNQLKAQGATQQQIQLKSNEISQRQATLRQTQQLRALELEELQMNLETLQSSRDKNVLYAPFSGRIISTKIQSIGAWVNEKDAVVFLADDTQLYLSGTYIKETEIARADRVYAHIGAQQYEIEMRPLDPQAYASAVLEGRTVNTDFDILGTEVELREIQAGAYASVCVLKDYVPDALLVPSGAISRDGVGYYVYVDVDGHRVRRDVTVGHSNDSVVQIVTGLQEGEVVYVN